MGGVNSVRLPTKLSSLFHVEHLRNKATSTAGLLTALISQHFTTLGEKTKTFVFWMTIHTGNILNGRHNMVLRFLALSGWYVMFA